MLNNFDTSTISNTSLFGQSTPVNSNRTENSFLFGNAKATPLSTPLLSSNMRAPANINKPPSLETTTFHKYSSTSGLDKLNKNIKHTSSQITLCHESLCDSQKTDKNSSPLSTIITTSAELNSFQNDDRSSKSIPTTFSFAKKQFSTSPISITTLGISSLRPMTTTATTHSQFDFSSPKILTSIAPMLPSTTSSSDFQSFRTMLNAKPFNNELDFLTRQKKTQINLDDGRLLPMLDTATIQPNVNLFPSLLTKPTVLSTVMIPTNNSLSVNSNTFSHNFSSTNSNKRKLADSFIDDDEDVSQNNQHQSIINDDLYLNNSTSRITIKRPRLLDMNKIRSIVLGSNESLPLKNKSETNLGWKTFSNYDEYISSKRQNLRFDRHSCRLPKLTNSDYYTSPTMDELYSYFNEHGQCFVKEFTIGRKHYGSVKFQGLKMNLAGLDLDRIVDIGHRQVTVYPIEEDRPSEGEELNCPAIISLFGVYPIDRSITNGNEEITDPDRLIDMNYEQYLERITKKFHGQFMGYDVYSGTWTFRVEHF